MKAWFSVFSICTLLAVASNFAVAGDFRAYYTKVDSGQEFEKYSRTGPYADIVVDLGTGHFVFWRGSSYLPYWEVDGEKHFVDEIIPREGDGPPQRPDIVNTYSRVAIVKNEPDQVVVYWRYLPQFSGKNPHVGVDQTEFAEEYFTITPDGSVTRSIKKGTPRIDEWRDPLNQTVQTFQLTADGLTNSKIQEPRKSAAAKAAIGAPVKEADVGEPVAWWKFDEAEGNTTEESISGVTSTIEGHKSLWKKGVSGTALQFDGYDSLIRLPADQGPQPVSAITLEAWIAVGAYPWSWTPIIKQTDEVPEELEKLKGRRAWLVGEEDKEEADEQEGDFDFVLKKENDTGYFLGIDGFGHPGLKIKVGDTWEELTSDAFIDRHEWHHVAGTYDKATGKMQIYVNGKLESERIVEKADIVLSQKDIKIGKGKPRRPIRPVRANTFIDSYGFDGMIDEVKIYDAALSAEQIAQAVQNTRPASNRADIIARSLPTLEKISGFGAYYTHLKFYETWDNLWRFGDHPDVVVEFDNNPSKFVFWRGVGYIPMLVNEEGHWYSNEFNETWNRSGGQGCQEPMSDKESYTNHARIIENNDARVVVHWRYPLVDVLHVIANYDEETGWGDWSDWYYYIYPDGVAVKTMHLWTHGVRDHEWQESMAILGPNQHPQDVLETNPALVLADLDGNVDEHLWVNGPPDDVDYDNKKIHIVKYQADYSPFTVGDFEGGNVYGGELTEYAEFPTWNHWPVGQMPSDGRFATFPDRTAHSSLTHVWMPTYKENFGDRPFEEKILMEGMTKKSAKELIPLAKSWLNAPAIEVGSGASSKGYDPAQRAYVLTADDGAISATIKAGKNSPVVNPALVIEDWGESDATLTVNGKAIERGKNFRYGHRYRLDGTDLIVWIKTESDQPVKIVLSPQRSE